MSLNIAKALSSSLKDTCHIRYGKVILATYLVHTPAQSDETCMRDTRQRKHRTRVDSYEPVGRAMTGRQSVITPTSFL